MDIIIGYTDEGQKVYVDRDRMLAWLRDPEVSKAVHLYSDLDKTDEAQHHTLTQPGSSSAKNPHQSKHG